MAYINTDVCMSGPILEPVASPTLMDVLVPATRDIVSPEDETQSYYDYWQQWSGQGDSFDPEVGCIDDRSDSISRFGTKICIDFVIICGFLLWSVVFHHMLHSKFHRLMINFTASIGPFGMV